MTASRPLRRSARAGAVALRCRLVLSRWLHRVRRRLRLRRPTRPRPLMDLGSLSRHDELSTTELWSAWTLANLDCEVELRAWSSGTRSAYHRYVDALAREARVADVLAARYA